MSTHGSFDCRDSRSPFLPLQAVTRAGSKDGWGFRPNLEPSCHIGGRQEGFPSSSLSSKAFIELDEDRRGLRKSVGLGPHLPPTHLSLAQGREKGGSSRCTIPPPSYPCPSLLSSHRTRCGSRCDGTLGWSLHRVTDWWVLSTELTEQSRWMLLTLFAALGCLPWDPRGSPATNGTRRSTSTPQMQPMSF